MIIWDGNSRDITDLASNKYLMINSCAIQNNSADFTVVRKQGRKDYHILLIESGRCEVDFQNKKHTLLPGNLVIYYPGEYQQYCFTEATTTLWIHFSGTCVHEILSSSGIASGVYFLKPSPVIIDTFIRMIRRFNQESTNSLANASLLELILQISNCIHSSHKAEQNADITNALTYINLNYQKSINLSELASIAGYSKSRFSHLFSELTGTTPIKYQNDIRLKVAYEMLSTQKLKVAYVAEMCGFDNPLYFSRLFAKKYGIPPSSVYKTNIEGA